MRKIVSNKAKCLLCHTIAESKNRHHLCFCSCGAMFVDGGNDYLRRGGNLHQIEDLSEFVEVPDQKSTEENLS